jgi:hypothetical protein
MSELEEIERRRKERTSFGPEQDGILYDILEKRNQMAKVTTKQHLQSLIRERADK